MKTSVTKPKVSRKDEATTVSFKMILVVVLIVIVMTTTFLHPRSKEEYYYWRWVLSKSKTKREKWFNVLIKQSTSHSRSEVYWDRRYSDLLSSDQWEKIIDLVHAGHAKDLLPLLKSAFCEGPYVRRTEVAKIMLRIGSPALPYLIELFSAQESIETRVIALKTISLIIAPHIRIWGESFENTSNIDYEMFCNYQRGHAILIKSVENTNIHIRSSHPEMAD